MTAVSTLRNVNSSIKAENFIYLNKGSPDVDVSLLLVNGQHGAKGKGPDGEERHAQGGKEARLRRAPTASPTAGPRPQPRSRRFKGVHLGIYVGYDAWFISWVSE